MPFSTNTFKDVELTNLSTPVNFTSPDKMLSHQIAGIDAALGGLSGAIVQEIIEVNDLASFPVTGEIEKVYVAKDTNKIYRWDGAAYQELAPAGIAAEISFDQELFVAKNGNDGTADGSLSKPYLTIAAAMAAITDASPTKRYAIKIQAGNYVESGDFDLKANVFLLGADRNMTRISATSFRLAADFTGNADNRSGFSDLSVLSPCNFDWAAVTSAAGKLYFQDVQFNTTLSLNGHNNGIAQAQMWGTSHFGAFTLSGINLLTVGMRLMSSAFMNQHPILATIWDANGGSLGQLTMTTTVNNFNRRCSMFAKSFFLDNVLVDGPVSYCDYTASSLGLNNSTANGGQLIPLNPGATGANTALSNLIFPTAVNQPIMPANSNATNFGDWGKQWFWNFGYVHASTGTDLFLISYPSAFGADAGPNGKSIGIYADGAGLQANVNGGNIVLQTAAVSGTGVRGRVRVNARELNVNNSKITEVAAGTDPGDAVNVSQLGAKLEGRSGQIALVNGQDNISVVFSSDLGTNDYAINFSVVNTIDANPKFFDKIITAKSSTGFSVKFHQNPDSNNYLLQYTAVPFK